MVVDSDDYFYFENRYYRHFRDHLEMSFRVSGPWEPVATELYGSVEERDFKVRQTIRGLAID